jgi:hypothetical protein
LFRQPTEMTVCVGEAQHQVLGASFLAVRPGAPTVLRSTTSSSGSAGHFRDPHRATLIRAVLTRD